MRQHERGLGKPQETIRPRLLPSLSHKKKRTSNAPKHQAQPRQKHKHKRQRNTKEGQVQKKQAQAITRLLTNAVQLHQPWHQVRHPAMGHQHALWSASGTACENDVGHAVVRAALGWGIRRTSRNRRKHLRGLQNATTVDHQRLGAVKVLRLRQQHGGTRVFQVDGKAIVRIVGVAWKVSSCTQKRKKRKASKLPEKKVRQEVPQAPHETK
jgi:hypothetical protein